METKLSGKSIKKLGCQTSTRVGHSYFSTETRREQAELDSEHIGIRTKKTSGNTTFAQRNRQAPGGFNDQGTARCDRLLGTA